MEEPPNWMILFVMGFITDIIYTLTIKFISQNKKVGAIIGNMLISLIGLVSTWIVINDQSWLDVVTFISGCGLGTFVVMTYHNRKAQIVTKPIKTCAPAKKRKAIKHKR